MRKILLALLIGACGTAHAATVKANGPIANELGVATTKTYVLPLNQDWIDQVAVQITWSSANPTNVNFTDGSAATATVTVSSFSALTNQTLLINQAQFVGGVNYTIGASSAATANNLAAAINASSQLSTVLTATAPVVCGLTNPCGIVSLTASSVGPGSTFSTFSSSQSALTLAPFTSSSPVTGVASGQFQGGSSSMYAINTGIILSTNPYAVQSVAGLQKTPMVALPVLYSTGSATAIVGLVNQTTYYVIPITPNAFGLSTTSTGAVAGFAALPTITYGNGTFIQFTSSQTKTTQDNYTLAPLAFSGTPAGVWQNSNDGMNWTTTTSTGTVTMAASGVQTSAFDFGTTNFAYMRFNLTTAPTQGGLNLLITVNGKNSYQ